MRRDPAARSQRPTRLQATVLENFSESFAFASEKKKKKKSHRARASRRRRSKNRPRRNRGESRTDQPKRSALGRMPEVSEALPAPVSFWNTADREEPFKPGASLPWRDFNGAWGNTAK